MYVNWMQGAQELDFENGFDAPAAGTILNGTARMQILRADEAEIQET